MIDRELLERAAKAAGIDLQFQGNHASQPGYYGDFKGLPQWETWNPLEDDGDALRLAVKLQMTVWTYGDRATAAGSVIPPNDGVVCEACADGDWNAATRRAIVRAAAAMAEKPTPPNEAWPCKQAPSLVN